MLDAKGDPEGLELTFGNNDGGALVRGYGIPRSVETNIVGVDKLAIIDISHRFASQMNGEAQRPAVVYDQPAPSLRLDLALHEVAMTKHQRNSFATYRNGDLISDETFDEPSP